MCRPKLTCRALVLACVALPVPLAAQDVSGGFPPGTLEAPALVGTGVANLSPFATADFDADGRADLVTGEAGTGVARLYRGGAGGLGAAQPIPFPVAPGIKVQPFAMDFDGDGLVDLLARATPSLLLLSAAGHGDGTFDAPGTAAGVPPSAVVLALDDVDGDALRDVVIAWGAVEPQSLEWLRGRGDGTFDPIASLGQAVDPEGAIVADFSGDGVPDLAHLDGGHVAVRLGLGGGAFGAASLGSSFADVALAAADFDLDGALDLLHGTATNVAAVLHGAGDGTVGEPQAFVLGGFQADLVAADLEGDGRPDVAALALQPASLLAQRMGPEGPVGAPQAEALPLSVPLHELALADFDGDGLADLVAQGVLANELVQALNGLGPFIDLGGATVTTQGAPTLELFGVPQAGSAVSVQLVPPQPPTAGVLVIGLAPLHAGFAGGVIVPSADVVLVVGGLPQYLVSTWPAGVPQGALVYLQTAYALAGGGIAVSNAAVIVPE
jgi:hypothetical protein